MVTINLKKNDPRCGFPKTYCLDNLEQIKNLIQIVKELDSSLSKHYNYDDGSPLYRKLPPLPIQLKARETIELWEKDI